MKRTQFLMSLSAAALAPLALLAKNKEMIERTSKGFDKCEQTLILV